MFDAQALDARLAAVRQAREAACAKLAVAAQKGADLLDSKKPGWHTKIDLGRLDMSSPWRCVLGQLFRRSRWPFNRGLRVLGITGKGAEYGFDYDDYALPAFLLEDELDVLWRALILARRAQRGGQP